MTFKNTDLTNLHLVTTNKPEGVLGEITIMRKAEEMKKYLLVVCPLVLAGCQLAPSDPYPSLVRRLAQLGVSDVSTRKIVLTGSEGDVGSDVQVTITEGFAIQEIWDTIYQSRPNRTWAASGFRRLRFYTDDQSVTPTAELLVNVTDRCHFEESFDDAFRCPGINKVINMMLASASRQYPTTRKSSR